MRSWLFPKLLWEQKAHPLKLCVYNLTGALARGLGWKRKQEPGQKPLGRLKLQGPARQQLHCGRKRRGSQV